MPVNGVLHLILTMIDDDVNSDRDHDDGGLHQGL